MKLVEEIIEAAEEVHGILGPGCSESTYHRAMEMELGSRGVEASSENTIPVMYKGSPVGTRRPDMFVHGDDGTVIVELKAGSGRGEGQLMNYLSILDDDNNYEVALGMLIQFNEELEVLITE